MSEIDIREAQLVFVELESQWDDEGNRNFALMRELETAENRLVATFTDEWRDRGGDLKTMRLAYSHFRKRLLWAAGKRKKRSSLLESLRISNQMMTTEGRAVLMQQSRNDEVIGKIFVVLRQDMRQCLICDGVFTRQSAAGHAGTVCHPSEGDSGIYGGSDHADR